jgi:uncharacterized membrane protein
MYDWLLFFHVLGAVAWFGGSIYVEALMAGAARTGDPRTIMRTALRVLDANSMLFTIAPGLTLLFGIWLVIEGPGVRGFEELWVSASFVLTLVVIGMGVLFFNPQGKRLAAIVEARGMEDEESRDVGRRIGTMGHASTGILFVIFVLMIFKPG